MEKVSELRPNTTSHSAYVSHLVKKHKKLEREIHHLEQYAPYSAAASLKKGELKKKKLKYKELIERAAS